MSLIHNIKLIQLADCKLSTGARLNFYRRCVVLGLCDLSRRFTSVAQQRKV